MHTALAIAFVLPALSAVPQAPPGGPPTSDAGKHAVPTATHRVDEVEIAGARYLRRETRANSFTRSTQGGAGLAMGPAGQWMVTWESRRQRDGMNGVYFQQFDAAGRRVGTEQGTVPAFEKVQCSLAGVLGAEPWLAWESFDSMREGGVLYLGRGNTEPPTRIGTGQANSVCLLPRPDGGVVAVFVQLDQTGLPSVWQQRFDAKGKAMAAPRALDESGQPGTLPQIVAQQQQQQQQPSDGSRRREGYVVAWAVQDARRMPAGLALRRFDDKDIAVGGTVRFPGREKSGSIEPSIASLADGSLVLAWHARAENYYDVMAQRFGAGLTPVGAVLVVAKAKTRLSGACIAATDFAGGRFCVAWNRGEGDATNSDVVARVFDRVGKPIGATFQIHKQGAGDQCLAGADNRRRLAFGPRGELAFAWNGDGDLGDASAAHLTLLLPEDHAMCAAARDARPEVLVAATARREKAAGHRVHDAPISRPHDPPVFWKPVAQDRSSPQFSVGDPGFVAITNTGWTPPDPHMAVGPNHVVVMTNGGIAFFTKSGTRTFFQNIVGSSGFWSAQGSLYFIRKLLILGSNVKGLPSANGGAPPTGV